MERNGDEVRRATRISTFAALGVLGVTQDLIHACLGSMEGADPELIAEETLCLVATATARSLEVGLQEASPAFAVIPDVLIDLPFTYREYLVGGAMIAQKDPELIDANRAVEQRLTHKQSFYAIHFPRRQFPGRHALNDKMALWMGRISPPGLLELPIQRLERLSLVDTLSTHLQLVLAYAKHMDAEG